MPYKYFSEGQSQAGNAAGQITGMIFPWYGAARFATGAMARPFEQGDKSTAEAIKQQNDSVIAGNKGMQMSSAPKTEASAFGAMGELGNMALPGSVRILNGADTPSPGNVVGGFSAQPAHVDSSQQSYKDSGLQDYLNYMKYQGGYR